MAPFFFEEELFMIVSALISAVPSLLMNLAAYVLSAMALYTIAQRRGIQKPWLAWIPVVNCWTLGSLSDQYQYVVKGRDKSKRKILLGLNVLSALMTAAVSVLAVVLAAGALLADNDAQIMRNINGPAMAILGMCIPMLAVSVASAVIRYMALFDVYRSLDPANSVLFLVLSILLGVTEPFFLFFNRNKDAGMPPRKQPEPHVVYEAEPVRETWTEEEKNYL